LFYSFLRDARHVGQISLVATPHVLLFQCTAKPSKPTRFGVALKSESATRQKGCRKTLGRNWRGGRRLIDWEPSSLIHYPNGGPPGQRSRGGELLEDLAEAISLVRGFLAGKGADLGAIATSTGFQRIAAIDKAKEAANENDETRKRFEIMARAVFGKFKACLTMPGVNTFRAESGAVSDGRIYDISAIDFDRLRREFEKSPRKKTEVQNLRNAIEKRLARILAENHLRTNYQQHFEEIVAAYNGEKGRVTIETAFEALMRLVGELDEEATRAMREGLDEETLALFDLLKKDDLEKKDIERLKKVAINLLELFKRKKQEIDDWRAKETTRDDMRQAIQDVLYNDATGLPEVYLEPEIDAKAQAVFAHVYRAYA
jgi:type I restriction enzyme, R subunit